MTVINFQDLFVYGFAGLLGFGDIAGLLLLLVISVFLAMNNVKFEGAFPVMLVVIIALRATFGGIFESLAMIAYILVFMVFAYAGIKWLNR